MSDNTAPQPDDVRELIAKVQAIRALGWKRARPSRQLVYDLADALERSEADRLTTQEMVELMSLVIMAGPNVPRSIDPIMRKMGDIIRRSEIEP